MNDEQYRDPFECDRCGAEILRDCVDFDGLCALCELEDKAQRQLPNGLQDWLNAETPEIGRPGGECNDEEILASYLDAMAKFRNQQ